MAIFPFLRPSPQQTRRRLLHFAILALLGVPLNLFAGGVLEITDLVAHPEQYDKQAVVVFGQVSNLQPATTREGHISYGFLLKAGSSSIKVVGLGKAAVREGQQVVVEGVFNRLRQMGRTIVLNEIKASTIRPLDRLNPDLVG